MLQMTLLRHNSELVTAARNPKAIQSAFDFPERLAPRQELLPRRRWVGGGGGGGVVGGGRDFVLSSHLALAPGFPKINTGNTS